MGIFYNSYEGLPQFLEFNTSATPPNIPTNLSQCNGFCASTAGLLLCHNPDSNPLYSIVNPFRQGAVRKIPNPSGNHPEGTARILVIRGTSNKGCALFNIVCAVPLNNGIDYKFDVYCSRTDAWASERNKRPILEKIRPETGVSFGTWACWLTPKSNVIFFNLEDRKNGRLSLIEDLPFHTPQIGDQRQLGVMPSMGKPENSLFLIVKNVRQLRLYEWIKMPKSESTTGHWKEMAHLQLTQVDETCILLSSQSKKLQILAGKTTGFVLWEPLPSELGPPHPSTLHRRSGFALGGQERPALTHALMHSQSDLHPVQRSC